MDAFDLDRNEKLGIEIAHETGADEEIVIGLNDEKVVSNRSSVDENNPHA